MDNERVGTGDRPSLAEQIVGKGTRRAIRWGFKHRPLIAASAYVARFSHDYLQRNGVKPAPPVEILPDISEYVAEPQEATEPDPTEEGKHA
jgi:hypothetical protein